MSLRGFLDNPVLYDAVQTAAGAKQVSERLRPHVRSFGGSRVLDVGAGTGRYVATVPDPAEYVALDLDPRKLERLRAAWPNATTVVADACRLQFAPGSFDHGLCTFLAHHLTDQDVAALTAGLRKVLRGSLVLIDPLRAERRLRSRILWSIDRGGHPRTAAELLALLDRDFVIQHEEQFQVHHRYLLCVATPRPDGATA